MALPRFIEEETSGKAARARKPKAHEKDTAKALGGRCQPASGSKDGFKGDVRGVSTQLTEFLVECKRTEDQSLRLQARWLNKITTEAGLTREPALAIQFEPDVLRRLTEPGQITAEPDWVAIPRSVFRRLLDAVGVEESEWASET